ncbi:MAG TPA: cyclase family protein [Vicinamibacterales bacterium]|jgi:kynurenine formamidase|nr:cyclase family protein [Vicinamibacterales bacterium]
MRLRAYVHLATGLAAAAVVAGAWSPGTASSRLSAQGPAAAASGPAVTVEQVDKWMTDLSNWGRWGKDDGIGTLNLITPAKRKDALKLVRDGISISLAHTIDKDQAPDNPRPLGQQMTLDAGGHAMDLYTIWYHGSIITHIDALCHYSFQGKIYNGYARSDIAQGPGCVENGIEKQKNGIITRGIVVDIPRMKNVPSLAPGTPVYPSDLEAFEKYAGIKIGAGDAVFLRTGRWLRRTETGAWNVAANAAGFHASVLPWLKQRDVALIGNDGVSDVQPSGVQGSPRPIHQVAIVAMGLPLVDVMDLEAVAAEAARLKRWEFLLTAAAVPVLGGTGFPLNPIATF